MSKELSVETSSLQDGGHTLDELFEEGRVGTLNETRRRCMWAKSPELEQ